MCSNLGLHGILSAPCQHFTAIRQLDYQIAGGKVVKRPLGSMKANDNLPLLIFIVPE